MGNSKDAFYYAEDTCHKMLASPSTAKFSGPYWDDSGCTVYGFNQWKAFGYVDAQNGFGAMIRQHWLAIVQWQADHYHVQYLRVGEQESGTMPGKIPIPLTPEESKARSDEGLLNKRAAKLAAETATAARKSASDAAVLKFHLARAQAGDPFSQCRLIELYLARGDTNSAAQWQAAAATNAPPR